MAFPIRICVPKVDNLINMKSTENPEPLINRLIHAWINMRPQLNVTWISSNTPGTLRDPATNSYDGCIGSMQRNESDFLPIMTVYDDLGSNVRTWVTMFADTAMIGSMYTKKSLSHGKATRVLDFLDAYSFTLWMLTGLLMLILSLFFLFDIRIWKRMKMKKLMGCRTAVTKTLDMALGCVLKQHSICANIKLRPMTTGIYLLMNLLGFYTGYFLTSMIKTDMIALDPPATYDTYQDLIDNDTIPLWLDEFSTHSSFEFAEVGSNERKIWDRAIERGLNHSMVSAQKVMASDPGILIDKLFLVADRRAAFLARLVSMTVTVTNTCGLLRQNNLRPGVNGYYRTDPTAQEQLRVMPGSLLTDERVRRHVSSAINRKAEMGILLTEIWQPFSYVVASPTGHVVEVEECISNVVVMPEHAIQAVLLHYYRDLLMLMACCICLSIIVMFVEKEIGKIQKARESEKDLWKERLTMNQHVAAGGQSAWNVRRKT